MGSDSCFEVIGGPDVYVAGIEFEKIDVPVPTENSIRAEGRILLSRGDHAFAADAQAKFMAST